MWRRLVQPPLGAQSHAPLRVHLSLLLLLLRRHNAGGCGVVVLVQVRQCCVLHGEGLQCLHPAW